MRSLKWLGFWSVLGAIVSVQLYFAHQRLGPDPWGWQLGVWLLIGLAIYFGYGRTHSKIV